MKIGVLVLRACGHAEYLVVEQRSTDDAREMYSDLSKDNCCVCTKMGEVKHVANEVVDRFKRRVSTRRVKISRP